MEIVRGFQRVRSRQCRGLEVRLRGLQSIFIMWSTI
jgi:hypothetical protein